MCVQISRNIFSAVPACLELTELRFTEAAHRNGMLRWHPDEVVLTLTDGTASNHVIPEGRFADGIAYRFLDQPLDETRSLSLHGLRPWPAGRPIACYERLQDSRILSSDLWASDNGQVRLIRLAHVPDTGHYHRIVLETGNLRWPENITLRSGRDTLRFVDGTVYGPWSPGVGSEKGTQASYEATIEVTYEPLVGRFIEVVAWGQNGQEARIRAHALLGHVNLIMGPNAYGRSLIDAYIDARWGFAQTYTLLTENQLGFEVAADSALDASLAGMENLSSLGGTSRAMVALARYGQGASTNVEELRFAAFVSGIDSVVSSFYSERSGGALGDARRKQAEKLVAEKLGGVDHKTVGRIKDALINPSFLDKFTFYVEGQGLDSGLISKFDAVKPRRNDLFHGGKTSGLGAATLAAKQILEAIICKETGVDGRTVWRLDRQFRTSGEFQLQGFGW